jgi:biopolymer transport protein ExbB
MDASNTTSQALSPEMAQAAAETATQTNLLQDLAIFMDEGGIFMWVILVIWIIGLAFVFERVKALFSYDVDGQTLMNNVKKHVLLNEVHQAIQYCSNSKSLLALVLKSGLKRSNQSKEQIMDAVESSILEVAPKVEKRMGHIALMANISTLFGLLGTIQGLIASFGAVAGADPANKAKLLALGISTAMNTTAAGLISAISIMIMHQVLTGKGEKILAELDEYSSKLVDLLGSKKYGLVEMNNTETTQTNSGKKQDKVTESQVA